MKKIAAASIAIALTAGGFAEAATMTFEGAGPVYDYSSTWEYSENGITAKVTGAYANPASSSPENTSLVLGYLDGHLPIRATFTMETPFHAISFFGSNGYRAGLSCRNTDDAIAAGGPDEVDCGLSDTYSLLSARGYRGDTLVAEQSFLHIPGMADTFDTAFNNLTSLEIFTYVDIPNGDYITLNSCYDPCMVAFVDNLTLAPVPLPGALPLLVTGAGAIAFAGRRRKKSLG